MKVLSRIGELKKVQEGTIQFQEGSISRKRVQEGSLMKIKRGSKRFKKIHEVSRWSNKVLKRFKKVERDSRNFLKSTRVFKKKKEGFTG